MLSIVIGMSTVSIKRTLSIDSAVALIEGVAVRRQPCGR